MPRSLKRPGAAGYVRVRVDGNLYDLSEDIKLEKNKKHTIEIVVDRLVVKEEIRSRLADSHGNGLWRSPAGIAVVDVMDGEELILSRRTTPARSTASASRSSPRGCFPSTTPSAPAQSAPAWAPS